MTLLISLLLVLGQSAMDATQAQNGSIEGVVFKISTGTPIPRARVTLSSTDGTTISANRFAMADDAGRFVFEGVSPGRYRLIATRDGYVRTEYGQRGPDLSGAVIEVAANQKIQGLGIAMTPTGAVAGRIYDPYGDPLANATVSAMKYTYEEGRRVLHVVQSAKTNDLGEYRLFWIQPGRYIVSATPPPSTDTLIMNLGKPTPTPRIGVTLSQSNDSPAGLPVYYPGTTESANAALIEVRPGADFGGVDLTTVEIRPVSITGAVVAPDAAGSITVYLAGRGTVDQTAKAAPVGPNGVFEFRRVTPGEYDLIARNGDTLRSRVTGPNASATVTASPVGPPTPYEENRWFGRTVVRVDGSDINNVQIQMQRAQSLVGRMTIEGRSPESSTSDFSEMHVQLRPDPQLPQLDTDTASVASDGTFIIQGIAPGDFRVQVLSTLQGSYVKSAQFGGADAMNDGLHIEGEPRGGLDVVIGTNAASVDVFVVDEKRQPVPGVMCVLVPGPSVRHRPELYKTATTDRSGRAHFAPQPGDYKAFAWEAVEDGAWQDPDFIRLYEDRGVPLRLEEGDQASATIAVIPYP